MKIFISWSGEKSLKVAQLLEEWIKCVLQSTDPWVSTNIDKGATWYSEIAEQLASVNFGIVCLTKANKENPWIMFESGALTKGLPSNRLFTFLIDLKNEEVRQPLAQFNHTYPEKQDVKRLIETINNHLENKLSQSILNKVFEKNWSEFEEKIQLINEHENEEFLQQPEEAKSNDVLIEILNTVRYFDKRISQVESGIAINRKANYNDIIESELVIKEAVKERIKQGYPDKSIARILRNSIPTITSFEIDSLIKKYRDEQTEIDDLIS